MMSRTSNNTEDLAYTAMSYVGLETGMSQHRPVQYHLYDNLDFAAAAASGAFQFQECAPPPLLAMPNNQPLAAPPMPTPMPMPLQWPMPMPVMPEYPLGLVKREGAAHAEAGIGIGIGSARLGLHLGRRGYFSPCDVLAVDRLLMRSRLGGVFGLGLGAHQPPRCQAEGCKADLSGAKHYHRRHKVCEYHAKAAVVAAVGKQQRFCQQCSRFHVLAEFDDAKRSCRKRLAEHNRRRRKPAQGQGQAQAGSAGAKDSSPAKRAAGPSCYATGDKTTGATNRTISSANAGAKHAKPTLSPGAAQGKLQGHQEHLATLLQHNSNAAAANHTLSSSSASTSAMQSNGDASEQNDTGSLHLFEMDFM